MMAEPVASKAPKTISAFPARAARDHNTQAIRNVKQAASALPKGACCRIVMAQTKALGDWYRKGRMIYAGIRNRMVAPSTHTANIIQKLRLLRTDWAIVSETTPSSRKSILPASSALRIKQSPEPCMAESGLVVGD